MKNIFKTVAIIGLTSIAFYACKKPAPTPTPLGKFDNVWINGNVSLTISSASSSSLISTSGGSVNTVVVGNTLMINGYGNAHVNIGNADTVFSNGSSTVTNSGPMNVGHMVFSCNGASTVTINNITATDSLIALANGSGIYTFSGTTPKLTVGANGNGTFEGYNMTSTNCDVAVNGSGKSDVFVTGILRAFINGNGMVYYKGNPTTVIPVMINGSGQLIKQ